MKLLLVDDEELTRAGLLSSIDFASFGITEVIEADDGVNGLNAAKKHRPDIILCDVRMPRMDGVQMMEQAESFLPNVCVIFMSGFSDKEYLKAAIKLKAIRYIEKPIDPAEIRETIAEAVTQVRRLSSRETARNENKRQQMERLAYCLTIPYTAAAESIAELKKENPALISEEVFANFFTVIARIEAEEHDERAEEVFGTAFSQIQEYVGQMHFSMIYSVRRLHHVVFHIYGKNTPTDGTIRMIAEKIREQIQPLSRFYLAVGSLAGGISNGYQSYTSAVIALQNSFFLPTGSLIFADTAGHLHQAETLRLEQEVAHYIELLGEGEETEQKACLDFFWNHLSGSRGISQNQLKSLYYEMFSALYKQRKKHQMNLDFALENQDNIMDIMDSCFSFEDLHRILVKKTEEYREGTKDKNPENSVIYLIREYIGAHYMEPDLSVKTISEYANLSASYTCTFFKSETGTTLSQYITEFRMKKAKQLLADPRITITEISGRVGYNDGNYFGKSFRRFCGISPSEYREQVLGK